MDSADVYSNSQIVTFVDGNLDGVERDKLDPIPDACTTIYVEDLDDDAQNPRIENGRALLRVMTALVKDDTGLFKQFSDNDSFRKWLSDTIFAKTYKKGA